MPLLQQLGAAIAISALIASTLRAQTELGPPLLLPPSSSVITPRPASSPILAIAQAVGPDQVLPIPHGGAIPPSVEELPGEFGRAPGISDLETTPLSDLPGWYAPSYWIGPAPWDTSIEFGLNGSTGSNEALSIRAGGQILRESRFSKLDLDATYNRTTTGGATTQNNAQFDGRNDWLLDESSPWTLYGSANVFYDEFRAFDLQTNANSGVGYRFVHDGGLDLIGRLGGGASREIGGPDDRWVPESHVGFEYGQRVWATQRFYGKLDYFPEWDQIGEYRLVADAGWEIDFIQPSNLSLKLSASDRFDSTPNGAKPHLVNYSLLMLLKL